jgi:hypothetical protein
MGGHVALDMLRSRGARSALIASGLLLVSLPVLVGGGVTALIAQQAQSCEAVAGGELPAGGGSLAAGTYAPPLQLRLGRTYVLGATSYGGPGDPTSGVYGAIPDPRQAYLPAHPDSFAELSVLSANPARSRAFTFNDANALANLPYLTQLRVRHGTRATILAKRDIGYGQGPGQLIANGQPYRLDVWWQAARRLGISKDAVEVSLAPAGGAAGTLGDLASSSEASLGAAPSASACTVQGAGEVSLALVAGARTRVLRSGLAAAGEEAPGAVRAMVAAGNRLSAAAYLYGGAHGASLDTLQGAYDCSSAVSYLLHAGAVLGSSALDSSALASYGLPGPGRYVSVYANPAHAFVYVAGVRFDTVSDPSYDDGPNAGRSGPRWRVSASVPAWSGWSVRHPPGL